MNDERPAGTPDFGEMSAETLIDRYGDDILRLCVLLLGDRQLAEDAFQIAMVKAWRQRATFRGESGVKTWLARIAVNTCRDMRRRGWFRLRERSAALDALSETPAPAPDETAAEVRRAVLALPDRYRRVVTLYYFEDMKLREIARALRLPESTVSTRLRRARAMLARALAEEE